MNKPRYAIFERTPFPNHWALMADCHLQTAERELQMNQEFYHERAAKLDRVLLYTWEDAQAIIAWREQTAPYSKHFLWERIGIDTDFIN